MVYNMDFYDGFGALLFLILMFIACIFLVKNVVYALYYLISKRRCHIYRTSNCHEYDKFLAELDGKKYELINVVNTHNRKGEDEYVVIYRRKKKAKAKI